MPDGQSPKILFKKVIVVPDGQSPKVKISICRYFIQVTKNLLSKILIYELKLKVALATNIGQTFEAP